jgi:hypothetical protein
VQLSADDTRTDVGKADQEFVENNVLREEMETYGEDLCCGRKGVRKWVRKLPRQANLLLGDSDSKDQSTELGSEAGEAKELCVRGRVWGKMMLEGRANSLSVTGFLPWEELK